MDWSPRRYREPSSTEAIYLRTETQVVSRSAILGQVSDAQFAWALAALESRYVILRAAVQAGHFIEKPPGLATPIDWLPGSVTAEHLYERLLDTRLDLTATINSVHVIRRARGLDIALLTSHAVTDATSLVELHSALIHFCDCAIREITPVIDVQPFPDTIDDAVARCLDILGHDRPPATAPGAYAGAFLQLPVLPVATAPQALRHRLHCLVIAASDMEPVIAAAHGHGVSLHCLLAAAFARAIQHLSEVTSPRLLLRCSVDLRRRLEPHLSVDLVFSAVTAHATLIEDMNRSVFEIARMVHDDIHASTTQGRIFTDYQNYPKAFGQPQDMPAALNISDMGRVEFHSEIATLKPAGFDYALGWAKPYPNVSVTVFEGRLVANIVYVETFIAASIIARMAETVVQTLRDCAQEDAAAARAAGRSG